jgi:hypothetical protein
MMKDRTLFSRLFLPSVASFLLCCGTTLYANDDDKNPEPIDRAPLIAIAKLFTPADMVAASRQDPQAMPLSVDAITGNLDGAGHAIYLVAAYGNGLDGRIRVFKLDAAGARLATESKVLGMGGFGAQVDLEDLDGDGKPEVIARFGGDGNRSSAWVLKWNGTQLSSITPVSTADGVPVSELMDAVFEDLDGSGTLYAVVGGIGGLESGGPPTANGVMRSSTYKLVNGQFVPAQEFFYATRVGGTQSPLSDTFSLGRLDVAYRLRVSNGDATGKNRVSNGEISVNDATLISKGDFDRNPRVLTATFQPRRSNTIRVNIKGSKKDTLFVAVEPVAPIKDLPVTPAVGCVWDDGGGRFTANFGYNNPNPWYITIDFGARNSFNGDRMTRGQGTVFLPGRNAAAFWVQSNGEALAWTLDGTTAAATLDVPRCTAPEPVPRRF